MTTANTSYAATGTEANCADLLLRVGDGDRSAWEEIVGQYGGLVSATVRAFQLQDADALDATQTTWLHLAEHWRNIPTRFAIRNGWAAGWSPPRAGYACAL
ncbi:MAG: sigma-70 family RNA polymerase sigma factor [Pseudonocardiales bacterium]|nr:sigma-70 family RNA polymerase sigma factor [Pseudonocardiales bacterium]